MGKEHYETARAVQMLQKYRELQDIIAILGMEELSDETRLPCTAQEKVQRFCPAVPCGGEILPASKENTFPLPNQSAASKAIISGEMDDYRRRLSSMSAHWIEVIEKSLRLLQLQQS